MQDLAGFPLSVSGATESVARITEILDATPQVTDGTVIRATIRSRGVIAFDDVASLTRRPAGRCCGTSRSGRNRASW